MISSLTQLPNCAAIWAAANGVAINGKQITQVNDSSGNANHLTAANQAGPELPGFYLQPVLAFVGASGEAMTIPAGLSYSPQNFSALCVLDSSSHLSSFNSFSGIFGDNAGADGLLTDTGVGQLRWFGGEDVKTTKRMPTSRCVIGVRGSATALTLYINGVAQAFPASGNAGTIAGGVVGKWATSNNPLYANIDVLAFFTTALSDSQMTDAINYLASTYNVNLNPSARLVISADSLTYGAGNTGNFNILRQAKLPSSIEQYSYAQSGMSIATMIANAATYEYPLLGSGVPTTVLSPAVGSNDIDAGATGATVYSRLQTLLQNHKNNGANYAVCSTIIPRNYSGVSTSSGYAQGTAFNALLRPDFPIPTSNPYVFRAGPGVTYADVMIDFAAMPHLAFNGAQLNTDNFAADNIHWSNAGVEAPADALRFAISLLPGMFPATGSFSVGNGSIQ